MIENIRLGMEIEVEFHPSNMAWCDYAALPLSEESRRVAGCKNKKCTSCRYKRNIITSAQNFSGAFNNIFYPTGVPSNLGQKGIYNLTTDGSINNGVEIVTAGLPIVPSLVHHVYEYITDFLKQFEVSTNQYCGIHFHVLMRNNQDESTFYEYPPHFLQNIYIMHNMLLPQLLILNYLNVGYSRYNVFRLPMRTNTIMENYNFVEFCKSQPPRRNPGKYLMATPYLSRFYNQEKSTPPELKIAHYEFRWPESTLDNNFIFAQAMIAAAIFASGFNELKIDFKDLIEAEKIILNLCNGGEGNRKSVVILTPKLQATAQSLYEKYVERILNTGLPSEINGVILNPMDTFSFSGDSYSWHKYLKPTKMPKLTITRCEDSVEYREEELSDGIHPDDDYDGDGYEDDEEEQGESIIREASAIRGAGVERWQQPFQPQNSQPR